MTLPVFWLYAGIPVILVILYVYFHVNVQRLWESLSLLPSYFPDGRPVDNVVFPWIGNAFVRSHLQQLNERPPLHIIQMIVNSFMVWWMVPATLLFMFGRYLSVHDWTITYAHITLLSLTVGLAIGFKRLASITFSTREPKFPLVRFVLAAYFMAFMLISVSVGAIVGDRPDVSAQSFGEVFESSNDVASSLTEKWQHFMLVQLPRLFQFVSYEPFSALAGEQISNRPPIWDGNWTSVVGAKLEGKNLRYADATGSFLAKANFTQADLTGIRLNKADLRGANLRGAKLEGADLRGVDLSHADLRSATIIGANLWVLILRMPISEGRICQTQISGVQIFPIH